jgi:KaiC/GvpD/RAD55 family RecA-like ATPase
MSEEKLSKHFAPGKLVFVALLPTAGYAEGVEEIVAFASRRWKKICLVSLTRPYSVLLEAFKHRHLDTSRILIVDAVSWAAEPAQRVKGVVFVSGPGAITELGLRIGDLLKTEGPDFLLFDSISVLTIYVEELEVLKFVHMLVSRTRSKQCCTVFTALQGDANSQVVKNLCMFADGVFQYPG